MTWSLVAKLDAMVAGATLPGAALAQVTGWNVLIVIGSLAAGAVIIATVTYKHTAAVARISALELRGNEFMAAVMEKDRRLATELAERDVRVHTELSARAERLAGELSERERRHREDLAALVAETQKLSRQVARIETKLGCAPNESIDG